MRLIFIALILILISCSSNKELVSSFNVKNLKNVDVVEDNSLIYALPKSKIIINLQLTKIVEIPGPYADFAEDLLGLENYIDEENEYYRISDISINTIAEPDQEHYYIISETGVDYLSCLNLSAQGLLISVNNSENISQDDNYIHYKNIYTSKFKDKDFEFKDRFLNRNIVEKSETSYRTVRTDSTTLRIPINRKVLDKKSIEDNATEAANFIIKLRKRKFKLMAGMYEKAPDGESVYEMLEEMKKLEENYVSLFMGKVFSEQLEYTFEFTPDDNNTINDYTFSYFSPLKGIFSLEELGSKPALQKGLNLRPLRLTIESDLNYLNSQINSKEISEEVFENIGIIYRIPVAATIHIFDGSDIIVHRKVIFPQFGKVISIPIRYINNSYSIDFYPQYGALKSIHKK